MMMILIIMTMLSFNLNLHFTPAQPLTFEPVPFVMPSEDSRAWYLMNYKDEMEEFETNK